MKDLDGSSSDVSGLYTSDCFILDDDGDGEEVVPPSKVQKLDNDQDPWPGPFTGSTDQAQAPSPHGAPKLQSQQSTHPVTTKDLRGPWPLVPHQGSTTQPWPPVHSQMWLEQNAARLVNYRSAPTPLSKAAEETQSHGQVSEKTVATGPAPQQGHTAVASRSQPEDRTESCRVVRLQAAQPAGGAKRQGTIDHKGLPR